MRAAFSLALPFVLAFGAPGEARALVWPDVPARIERALTSSDPETRRAAAADLASLGAHRAAPLVLRALEDADTEVRVTAAQAAIKLRVAAATEAVLPWLGERDTRLRALACEIARALPHPRATAPLARALGDADATVRGAAAEALGAQSSPEAVPPLLGRLDDASPTVRVLVVRSLARLGDARAVVPLVGKVQDSAPEMRQAVARALGDLGDAQASPALVLALRDAVVDVRVEAIQSLGRLRAKDSAAALAPLCFDRIAVVRQAALSALGRIGTPDAVRALIAALGSGDDATAELERSSVREALVAAGPAAVPELRAILAGTPTRSAALGAAWALGQLRARSEAPVLVAAMRRGVLPAPAALRALAGAGDGAAVPVVLEYIGDGSPLVRAEARRAAAALLDPSRPDGRAVEPLAAALKQAPTADERAALALLLGRTGAPRAAGIVAGLATAKERSVRLAALEALGTLASPETDNVLLRALSDEDAVVRLRAAMALAASGGARAADELEERLDAPGESDRAAVLTALSGVVRRHLPSRGLDRLRARLDMAAGAERDALVVVLASAARGAGLPALEELAKSSDPDDRRAVAAALGGRPEDAAHKLALGLFADADASVRAQAAWSLGNLGDERSFAPLVKAALGRGPLEADVAIDATAALARITARRGQAELAARQLCPLLDAGHPYARANALVGLAHAGARCSDGSVERRLFEGEHNEVTRAAAAAVLARKPLGAEETRLLERCVAGDRSALVAARCRTPLPRGSGANAVTVYVVPDGASTPLPGAAYALAMPDGFVRAGLADRRGAVFEAAAPDGFLSLQRPSGVER